AFHKSRENGIGGGATFWILCGAPKSSWRSSKANIKLLIGRNPRDCIIRTCKEYSGSIVFALGAQAPTIYIDTLTQVEIDEASISEPLQSCEMQLGSGLSRSDSSENLLHEVQVVGNQDYSSPPWKPRPRAPMLPMSSGDSTGLEENRDSIWGTPFGSTKTHLGSDNFSCTGEIV
ncbi:hypothetical protein QYM36_016778, partial [Artemia franciscana]